MKHTKNIYFFIFILTTLCLTGCASISDSGLETGEISERLHKFNGDSNKKKNIFVFLDGTRNDEMSKTNIWKLFNIVKNNNDHQLAAFYIKGVGSSDAPLTGAILGRGMQERILKAYKFISESYKPGDNIYIFGFSRGAHQARSLAGLISYVGIPMGSSSMDGKQLMKIGDELLELLKKKSDSTFQDKWQSWQTGQQPILSNEIKDKLNLDMQPAEVAFLGVWDTVHGSSLKPSLVCKEDIGIIKTHLSWLIPGIDKEERYKTDSYPPIQQIAHAVSIDEKRSKYSPLLLCEPINANQTKISEVWFPGSHSDVGGGYGDSEELPDISLEWMINLLKEKYKFRKLPQLNGNATGLAHWSYDAGISSAGSKCVDRNVPEGKKDRSFDERRNASPVPIIMPYNKKEEYKKYPFSCSDYKNSK